MSASDEFRADADAVMLLQQCRNGLACQVLKEARRIAQERGKEGDAFRITADDVRQALPIAARKLLDASCAVPAQAAKD